ncbi:hypothetical protein [Paenibacillus lautus]|uniref:hypothetical protein n=1 Tax=Paenibacillus lautus TaxID=1401 RepID=UPI002DBA3910|nr:hypothetical protein [Paenibacillus lautus]MEC0259999.1 hypothetical protein [Paenibacillus lautus]
MDVHRRYILRHAYHRSNLTSDTLAYSEAGAEVTKPEGRKSEPWRPAGLEAWKLGSSEARKLGHPCGTAFGQTERSYAAVPVRGVFA